MYDPKDVFTADEIKLLNRFALSISNSMIPLHLKDHYYTSSGKTWDIDTYTHGAAKCLAMGQDDFRAYYDSKIHEDLAMCSNLGLFYRLVYDYKVKSFQKLKEHAGFADRIFVVEAGRGIDVLLASFVKKWANIAAYDQDKSVLWEMQKFFAGELSLPFTGLQINTFNHNFGSMNERTIIFGTCHNLTADIKKQIVENKNLLAILDGDVYGD